MTRLNSEEIQARMKAALDKEAGRPLRWWYLSYVGEEGWRGAVVVEAPGFASAVLYANLLHVSPGGEVRGLLVPDDKPPGPEFVRRLLDKKDVELCWGEPVKTIAEFDRERENEKPQR